MTDKSITRRDVFKNILRGSFLAGLVGTCAAIASRDPETTRCDYTGRCDGCPIEPECSLPRKREENR